MQKIVIKKLFSSFGELESAIGAARRTLEKRDNPPQEILERITQYEEMLDKQRNLATALCGFASLGNWDEVARHIRIINGLSTMIRDDAREIISTLSTPDIPEERLGMMC